jgi:hypothetical protein
VNHDWTDRDDRYNWHTEAEAEEKPAMRRRPRRKEHDDRQREADNQSLPHSESPFYKSTLLPSRGEFFVPFLTYTSPAIAGKGIPGASVVHEMR